jgi:hypothetical protein
MILVVGGTGTVGSALVRELAARDAPAARAGAVAGEEAPFRPRRRSSPATWRTPAPSPRPFTGSSACSCSQPRWIRCGAAAGGPRRGRGARCPPGGEALHDAAWASNPPRTWGAGMRRPMPPSAASRPGRCSARHSFMQNTLAFAPPCAPRAASYAPTAGAVFPLWTPATWPPWRRSASHGRPRGETYVLTGPEAIGSRPGGARRSGMPSSGPCSS